jgi:hypothetical protein
VTAKAIPALLLASLALAAGACSDGDRELGAATVRIATSAEEVRFVVELAETAEEREQGLMHRESLPERSGMLFLYERPTSTGFWMKDTLIPLSIAFLDADGRILRILDMEPCRAEPCPVYVPGVDYLAALEVNRGAFERAGVEVGDRVTVERS